MEAYIWQKAVCLLIGYACGLIQTGYLIGKAQGIDIRSVGSGNAGTTNMLRTFGVGTGVLTLLCDAAKTLLAMVIAWLIFRNSLPDIVFLLQIYAGAGAILGHDFPFYMGFRGGKGIACTAGLAIGLMDPVLIVLGLLTFFIIFFTTHYVSLGSCLVWLGLIVEIVIMGQLGIGKFGSLPQGQRIEIYVIMLLLGILAWWQHRSNIQRLLAGKERKTYLNHEKNLAEAERFKAMQGK